jgi:hypothetical protein
MIDKEKYPLTENNYYKEEFTKKQIIIGSTNRSGMYHYDSWVYRHNGKYKKTAPYTIDTEGNIFEHYDPKYYSDFLGKEQDKISIPILLVNEGHLEIDSMGGRYIDWLGNIYSNEDNEIIMKRWSRNINNSYLYWKRYTKEQMSSLVTLIEKLCEDFGIEKNVLMHNAFFEDADLHDGILYRSNYLEEVCDVSPAFDISKLKKIENE